MSATILFRRLVAGVVVFIASINTPAYAWEADVHYGLTKWLALKAGFSPSQAEDIAKGDVGVDSSHVTDPIMSSLLSCRSDDSGSNTVHDNHFASKMPAPGAPPARRVTPGEVWIKQNILPVPPGSNRIVLGQYLHTFQDSWSHQAEPDVPPTCNSMLAWAHAQVRGGWSCHIADLTYRWHDDVVAMAGATYEILRKRTAGRSPAWSTLLKSVEDFAARRSKWEKDDWFRSQWAREPWFAQDKYFRSLEFLQGLTVPDCREAGECKSYDFSIVGQYAKSIGESGRAADVPGDVFDLFGKLLTTMVGQSTGTTTELIDAAGAQGALANSLNIREPCAALTVTMAPLMLTVGMVRGDGARQPLALCELALEKRLNGQPLSCTEALDAIGKALNQPQRVGPSLAEVRSMSKGPDFDYFVERAPAEGTYIGTVRFRHVMNDVLRLRVRTINGQLRISTFAWVPRQ
jgi:hypothetical protein